LFSIVAFKPLIFHKVV